MPKGLIGFFITALTLCASGFGVLLIVADIPVPYLNMHLPDDLIGLLVLVTIFGVGVLFYFTASLTEGLTQKRRGS